MEPDELETTQLLQRWYAGENGALDALLADCLPWVRARVRQRLGPALRRKLETGDVVQDALMRFLTDGPRLQIRNSGHLRGILARIVENVLCDKADWFSAKRRALARECALSDHAALPDDAAGPVTLLASDENHDRVRLALELLEPEARRLVVLRAWDGLGFPEIAEQLGISPKAADTRYRRALARLAVRYAELERMERDDAAPDTGDDTRAG